MQHLALGPLSIFLFLFFLPSLSHTFDIMSHVPLHLPPVHRFKLYLTTWTSFLPSFSMTGKVKKDWKDQRMVKVLGECLMREEASGYSSSHNFSTRKREDNKGGGWKEMEEVVVAKRRVMVVIDHSTRAKYAMMWGLTYVANEGDLLTLLHVLPPQQLNPGCREEDGHNLVNSLSSLCKACKPEVAVEALVIRGPKLATVLNQVRKLEVSVLVLSQSKPSLFSCMLRSSSEEFVEQCVNKAECLTMAVRKQSKGVGGYLVSTRWRKNFWLLA